MAGAAQPVNKKKNADNEDGSSRRKRREEDELVNSEDMPFYKDTPLTQLQMFEYIIEGVNYEEERLQLWMLMSLPEKLDMLSHQLIEQEA